MRWSLAFVVAAFFTQGCGSKNGRSGAATGGSTTGATTGSASAGATTGSTGGVSTGTSTGSASTSTGGSTTGTSTGGLTDTQPFVTITSVTANATIVIGQILTVSGTVSDNLGVSEVDDAIDSGSFSAATGTTSWSYSLDTSTLSAGAHTLHVQASDAASNVGSASVSITLVVASVSNLPTSPTNVTATAISVSGTGITAYEYSLDGGAYSSATAVATALALSGLADGSHTLDIVAGAGNGFQDVSHAEQVMWTVDATAPGGVQIQRATPSASPSTTTTLSATVSTTDPSTTNYTYDYALACGTFTAGARNVSWSTPISVSGIADSTCTLSVRAKDEVGNTSAIITDTWVVDLTGPTLVLSGLPPPATSETSFTMTVSSTAPDWATYAYSLSGPVNLAQSGLLATSPQVEFASLPAGVYLLFVYGYDALGNVHETSTDFDIDPTIPIVTCPQNFTALANNAGFTVNFNVAVDDTTSPPSVTGPLGAKYVLAGDNKSMTVSPASGTTWSSGVPLADVAFTIEASSTNSFHYSSQTTCSFDIVPASTPVFYASPIGTDTTTCTSTSPCGTLAQTLTVASASGNANVIIEMQGGNYVEPGESIGSNHYFIYGGYNADYSVRDIVNNATSLSATTGANSGNVFTPVTILATSFSSGVLDGLTLHAPSPGPGSYVASLFLYTASNYIVRNDNLAPPLLADSSQHFNGVQIYNCSPVIENDTIVDDDGAFEYGIFIDMPGGPETLAIKNNTIAFTSQSTNVQLRQGIFIEAAGSGEVDGLLNGNSIVINAPSNQDVIGINAAIVSGLPPPKYVVTNNNLSLTGSGAYAPFAIEMGGLGDVNNNNIVITGAGGTGISDTAANANGNTIVVNNTGSSTAVCTAIQDPTGNVENNTINVNCDTAVGVLDVIGASTYISDNDIFVGGGHGIAVEESGANRTQNLSVEANTILGGDIYLRAMPAQSIAVSVLDNSVTSAVNGIALVCNPDTPVTGFEIGSNQVVAAATGLGVQANGSVLVDNNWVISGGVSFTELDASHQNASELANNTVVQNDFSPAVSGSTTLGPALYDNIFTTLVSNTAIAFTNGTLESRSIQNNDIFDFSVAFTDTTANTSYASASDVNAIGSAFADNFSVDPVLTGYTPASTDCNLRYGAQEDVSVDITNAARTAQIDASCAGMVVTSGTGYSVGALELP